MGPVSPDPNDPDLWDEWYADDTEGDPLPHRWPTGARLVAVVVVVAFLLLIVLR